MNATAKLQPISAVVINKRHPQHLSDWILPALIRSGLVSEIIVSHQSSEVAFPFQSFSDSCVVVHQHDYTATARCSSLLSHIAGARNPAVLVQDDEIFVPKAGIHALVNEWQAAPDLIHGNYGNDLTPDFALSPRSVTRGRVTAVQPPVMVLSASTADSLLGAIQSGAFNLPAQLDLSAAFLLLSLWSINLSRQPNRVYGISGVSRVRSSAEPVMPLVALQSQLLQHSDLTAEAVKLWGIQQNVSISKPPNFGLVLFWAARGVYRRAKKRLIKAYFVMEHRLRFRI